MALTVFCKKCKVDVPPGETCPFCGAKLNINAQHAAWYIERKPYRDWMCWNSVMRIALPALATVFLLVAGVEMLSGGLAALEKVFSGLVTTLVVLVALLFGIVLLILSLQGKDILDCSADSRGIHVRQLLAQPTALQLILRLNSPAMLENKRESDGLLLLSSRDIAWKDVARVQLWPEKALMLFYAPSWWLRVYLPCTPYSWGDTARLITEKIGKKKNVRLPRELRAPEAPKKAAKSKATKHGDLSDIPADMLQDIMMMNAEDERAAKKETYQ